jgi:hypothetical protein
LYSRMIMGSGSNNSKHPQSIMPSVLQRNPYNTLVVQNILDEYKIHNPVIYYPGSGPDASLAFIEGASVIHVDSLIEDKIIAGFHALGFEAHQADSHVWKPNRIVDVVAFYNPGGIDASEVIDQVELSKNNLIIWYYDYDEARPHELQKRPDMELLAVIKNAAAAESWFDRIGLDEYFVRKPFSALTSEEVQDFEHQVNETLGEHEGLQSMTTEELYAHLQFSDPASKEMLYESGYIFPYLKKGGPFIYRKH